MTKTLSQTIREWRTRAQTFDITCGDSEVEGAYYRCADVRPSPSTSNSPRSRNTCGFYA